MGESRSRLSLSINACRCLGFQKCFSNKWNNNIFLFGNYLPLGLSCGPFSVQILGVHFEILVSVWLAFICFRKDYTWMSWGVLALFDVDLEDFHFGDVLKRLWGVLQGFSSDKRSGIQNQPKLPKTQLTVCSDRLSLCRFEKNTVRVLCRDNCDVICVYLLIILWISVTVCCYFCLFFGIKNNYPSKEP